MRAMVSLAGPVVLAQLSQMSMGFIDTVMVGRLGPEQLGAVGIGSAFYFVFMVFSFGIVAAVGPLVAHAHGAGDTEEVGASVGAGAWIAAGLTVVAMVLYWNIGPLIGAFAPSTLTRELAVEYVRAMSFGFLANMVFSALRAFTDGIGRTRVAMTISFIAVFINVAANWILIYGHLGAPRLGAAGAGYATAIVRWAMLAMMLYYIVTTWEFRQYLFIEHARTFTPRRIGHILRLGVPIGAGHSMENGVFAMVSLLMGTIGTVALAAHQVAINLAAFTFMVPLGISIAVSTRVGQAMGRREPDSARRSGQVGIALGGAVMSATALVFLALRHILPHLFTDDPAVVDYAASLLLVAGAFQVSDGLQVTAMGALRGLKDTARPMLTNLFSYWLVGLPVGYVLAFEFDLSGVGLWWGLTLGLSLAAMLHTLRFLRLARSTGAKQPIAVEV